MRGSIGRYARQESSGAAAVEFAIILPLLAALLLGGYEAARVILTYRKLCDVTAQLANIASQEDTGTTQATLQGDMGLASQVIYPYSTTGLTLIMSEIDVAGNGAVTVGWSEGWKNGAVDGAVAYAQGSPWTGLPTAMQNSNFVTMSGSDCSASSSATCYSYILVQSSYTYNAAIGGSYVGFTIPLSDQVYFPPRNEADIACEDTSNSAESDNEAYC
jgi:Flp pilus assembly protein TadG